jgi:hypothetical protein
VQGNICFRPSKPGRLGVLRLVRPCLSEGDQVNNTQFSSQHAVSLLGLVEFRSFIRRIYSYPWAASLFRYQHRVLLFSSLSVIAIPFPPPPDTTGGHSLRRLRSFRAIRLGKTGGSSRRLTLAPRFCVSRGTLFTLAGADQLRALVAGLGSPVFQAGQSCDRCGQGVLLVSVGTWGTAGGPACASAISNVRARSPATNGVCNQISMGPTRLR